MLILRNANARAMATMATTNDAELIRSLDNRTDLKVLQTIALQPLTYREAILRTNNTFDIGFILSK